MATISLYVLVTPLGTNAPYSSPQSIKACTAQDTTGPAMALALCDGSWASGISLP